jgi:hypothetical protein
MRGLDPRTHVFVSEANEAWMAGSSPAMTMRKYRSQPNRHAIALPAKGAHRTLDVRGVLIATELCVAEKTHDVPTSSYAKIFTYFSARLTIRIAGSNF